MSLEHSGLTGSLYNPFKSIETRIIPEEPLQDEDYSYCLEGERRTLTGVDVNSEYF